MKKLKSILFIFVAIFLLTACGKVDISPNKKELDKVNLEATNEYDKENVREDIKKLIDRNFKKEIEYKIPKENEVYKLSLAKEVDVDQQDNENIGTIGMTFNKDSTDSYTVAILPVDEDFEPKSFYIFYSGEYYVDLYEQEGFELVMNSKENNEFVAQFKGKDDMYYVITIKSDFNVDENYYILKKINENLMR